MERRLPRTADLIAGLAALALIAFATLVPSPGAPSNTGFLCLGCGTQGATDVVVNVMLFLPLGIVLGRLGWRPLVAFGMGLALSGAIEFAQQFIPGRASTLRDVLMNGLGAGVGSLLVWRLGAWLEPGLRSRVLHWLSVLGVLLAVALTAALLRFDPPTDVYYRQWRPEQRHLERWTGRLTLAEVHGIAVPDGRSRHSDSLRRSIQERVVVRLVGTSGRPTRRLSSIFTLMDDAQEEAVLVGPHGDDLVVRVRRLAATWRLDAPEFRYRNALAGIAPGTPISITFDGTRLGGCATVNGVEHCVGRPRAGSTWQLARSFDGLPPLAHRLLDAMTLVVLVLPFGLLLRSVPRREAIAAGAARDRLPGGRVVVGARAAGGVGVGGRRAGGVRGDPIARAGPWSSRARVIDHSPRSRYLHVQRAGDEVSRASDEMSRASDEVGRADDEVGRAGDEMSRAGDEMSRASDEVSRAGDEVSQTMRWVVQAMR